MNGVTEDTEKLTHSTENQNPVLRDGETCGLKDGKTDEGSECRTTRHGTIVRFGLDFNGLSKMSTVVFSFSCFLPNN